jgi:hypothetical protein
MKKQLKLSGEKKDKFFTLIEKLQEDMQSLKKSWICLKITLHITAY